LAWKRGEGNTIGDVVVTFARSGVLSEGPEGMRVVSGFLALTL